MLCKVVEFVCHIYGIIAIPVNETRCKMFAVANKPKLLPLTENALKYHVMRAHYQTMVWKQATLKTMVLPNPEDFGWQVENNQLTPILMSFLPIPKYCQEIISY